MTRRVVVKAHVARLHAGGAKAAALHLRYIERDGVEKDGSKGVLYGAEGPVRAEAFEQPRLGEKHQFRIIVAPEDGAELELTAYVRRLMAQVERDLGRRVEWAAVNHYDTAHPHAHLVIRGVDRAGREVRLDRDYIAHGMRSRAQELATQELGPRRDVEVRRMRAKEVTQERFTSLDRQIERRADSGRVDVRTRHAGRVETGTLVARMEYLEGLRLAERTGPASWTLTPGWQEQLRALGARGDILKQIHMAVAGDRARYRIVRAGEPLDVDRASDAPILFGRIAAKGLSDELKGTFYAVLETPSGHAYHVPLDARGAEAFQAGDLVSFTTRPEPTVRPVDREIATRARAAGGAYTLEATADGAPHPYLRRLRDLERLGLAVVEAPNRWRVSPTLLQDLEDRQRAAPARHHLLARQEPLSLAQQVSHPGEVWLDRLEANSIAPYGFGAEVKLALERRREVLRQLGIRPDDPNRGELLREFARRAAGREMATRTSQVFVSNAPEGFRGRIRLTSTHVPDAQYAIVSDGARFAVLPVTESLRALSGKTVTLVRDARGHVVARPTPDKDLGR